MCAPAVVLGGGGRETQQLPLMLILCFKFFFTVFVFLFLGLHHSNRARLQSSETAIKKVIGSPDATLGRACGQQQGCMFFFKVFLFNTMVATRTISFGIRLKGRLKGRRSRAGERPRRSTVVWLTGAPRGWQHCFCCCICFCFCCFGSSSSILLLHAPPPPPPMNGVGFKDLRVGYG